MRMSLRARLTCLSVPMKAVFLALTLRCGTCCVVADVVDPAGDVDVLVLRTPGCKGWCGGCFGQEWCLWAACRDSLVNMEERSHLLFCDDGFGASVHLHGQFQHQWGIVDGHGLVLEPL